MKRTLLRGGACLALGVAIASSCVASRTVGGAPAASSVAAAIATAPGAAHQADDSASMRQGAITAVGEHGDRMQVQGVWCDVGPGLTQVLRGGQQARLDSLKVGDTIRFTLAPGASERPVIRVIYAQ